MQTQRVIMLEWNLFSLHIFKNSFYTVPFFCHGAKGGGLVVHTPRHELNLLSFGLVCLQTILHMGFIEQSSCAVAAFVVVLCLVN